jgi:hypothetical protein
MEAPDSRAPVCPLERDVPADGLRVDVVGAPCFRCSEGLECESW